MCTREISSSPLPKGGLPREERERLAGGGGMLPVLGVCSVLGAAYVMII